LRVHIKVEKKVAEGGGPHIEGKSPPQTKGVDGYLLSSVPVFAKHCPCPWHGKAPHSPIVEQLYPGLRGQRRTVLATVVGGHGLWGHLISCFKKSRL